MADPVSGSIIAAELLPTAAASIPTLAGVTQLAAPFAAEATAASLPGIVSQSAPFMASANPLVNALGQGQVIGGMSNPVSSGYGAAGESLFGFDPSVKGFGQGVMESIGGANKWMNQNPITSQIAMQTAKGMMQQPQTHYAQPGQISRGQIQPMDYMSLLNPQQPSVIRQQPISLL